MQPAAIVAAVADRAGHARSHPPLYGTLFLFLHSLPCTPPLPPHHPLSLATLLFLPKQDSYAPPTCVLFFPCPATHHPGHRLACPSGFKAGRKRFWPGSGPWRSLGLTLGTSVIGHRSSEKKTVALVCVRACLRACLCERVCVCAHRCVRVREGICVRAWVPKPGDCTPEAFCSFH